MMILNFWKSSAIYLLTFSKNKKETHAVLFELDFLRRNLIKVLDKKGVVVVADDDALITAYGIFT